MLYDIGFAIFSLFYLQTLIFKGKLHRDFLERFGVYSAEKAKALKAANKPIWIQAVSVGEVALCKTLIPKLRAALPEKDIVLSTITKTGNDLAKKLFSNEALVVYFPLDFSFTVKKAVDIISPGAYVMVETEIWPNFIKEISSRDIPSVIINGRISDRSYGKYLLARPFLKDTLDRISVFCMQSDLDAQRIRSIGAPKEKIDVTGNMKFDAEGKIDTNAKEELLKAINLEPYDRLFVAGSTHEGEEEAVLGSFREIAVDFPGLKLLIAPRHVERARKVEKACLKAGYNSVRLSDYSRDHRFLSAAPILILDKIGYLNSAYSLATLVFIGGSLVSHGGQNPIEPAILGKPVIFGPHMFNFKDIARAFVEADAAVVVRNGRSLAKRAKELLRDTARCEELGRNARQAVLHNRGATERNLDKILKLKIVYA